MNPPMNTITGRLTLAFQSLEEFPAKYTKKYGKAILELDLSHNQIVDYRFLMELENVHTLILDHNTLHSHTKFPRCDSLKTLWVNHNKINNLGYFISSIGKSFPNLQYLSMMNNPAAPSYFNGGTYMQYRDYRYFVISQLPDLTILDDSSVTEEERSEATRIYSQHLPMSEPIKERRKSSRRKSGKDTLPDLPTFDLT